MIIPYKIKIFFWSALVITGSDLIRAEVVDSSAIGFTIQDTVIIEANPIEVYHTLVADIGRWWDSTHTFSGHAANLSIDDKAGGCFCEKLENGGSVRHLEVVFADPGKTLRMIGGLGPLQAMAVAGVMEWSISNAISGTIVKVNYVIGGYRPGGLQKMAPLVDNVLYEQLVRLKVFTETNHLKNNLFRKEGKN
jgi:hypothetical protein